MGSSELSSRLSPFAAIMEADLSSLFKSKLTYGWLIAALFLEVVRVLGGRLAGNTSNVIGAGFSDFLLIWSLIIIGITASAVSSESGEFADSIMSKSVTRFDYLFAKFSARIVYVLSIFGAVALILIGLSVRLLNVDYTFDGLIFSILLVVLALVTLTIMGVAISAVAPNTIIAIISLLVIWYFMTFLFPPIELSFLSPSSLAAGLPVDIKGLWSTNEWKTVVGYLSISLVATTLATVYFYFKDF